MSREPIHLDPPIPSTNIHAIVDPCLPSPATDIWSAVATTIGLGSHPSNIERSVPQIPSATQPGEHNSGEALSFLDGASMIPGADCATHCCPISEPDCAGYVDGHHDWTQIDPVATILHGARGVDM